MENRMMGKVKNELTVVTRVKDLCAYIMTVTQKSPKNFQYTYVSRLQNLAMDCLCVISNNVMLASTLLVKKIFV